MFIVSFFLFILSGTALAAVAGETWKGFPDVEKGSYYETSVGGVFTPGIISGYDTGNFGPQDNVSRAQVATMLDRYNQKVVAELKQENAYLKALVCYQFKKEDYDWNDYKVSWDEMCAPEPTP